MLLLLLLDHPIVGKLERREFQVLDRVDNFDVVFAENLHDILDMVRVHHIPWNRIVQLINENIPLLLPFFYQTLD